MSDASRLLREPTDAAIAAAGEAIRCGELLGMPTETVYGLAANALDDRAVARVFEAKARPSFDPLIVHVADVNHARRYAARWPEAAARLAAAFWPGPLTLVVNKRRDTQADDDAANDANTAHADNTANPARIANPVHTSDGIGDLVTSGLNSVALRVPSHRVARALIEAAGVPIAAPSANRFGRISPTRPEHVVEELGDAVAMVLDGGACETGVESTVVSCTEPDDVRVLRLGGVGVEALEQVLGRPVPVASAERAAQAKDREGSPSPGMLDKHYAPATPLRLCDRVDAETCAALRREGYARVGVLRFASRGALPGDACEVRAVLSEAGALPEAATNLFAAMRRLDAAGVDVILAERAPQRDLGRAINDRLYRASRR